MISQLFLDFIFSKSLILLSVAHTVCITNFEEFFIEDGTVEFFNNILILLSTSAVNIKDLTKEFLDNLAKESEKRLAKENITDQDRYILNHKIDIIKEIRI